MWYGIQDLAGNLLGIRAEGGDLKAEGNALGRAEGVSGIATATPDKKLNVEGAVDSSFQVSGFNPHPSPAGLRPSEFWALRDISFDLKRGECLGLIGDNGAGKTTLLRLITGIFPPDGGEIALRGRLGALIALGAGFHPHMTGRENIYLNGAILGMPRNEINAKLDDIVNFAEIGLFLDAPVSTYSSGMRVRLGFSIAVHTEPDILLVDEILAVGDLNFQEKCMRKMESILSKERAVILVTHSLYRVESLCTQVLWLEHGACREEGETLSVVKAYLDAQEDRSLSEQGDENATQGASSPITIEGVDILDDQGLIGNAVPFGICPTFRIRFVAHRPIRQPLFNVRLIRNGRSVVEACMLIDGAGPEWVEGAGRVECRFGSFPLTPKIYDVVIFVRTADGGTDLCPMRSYVRLRITDKHLERIPMRGPFAFNALRQGSPVYLPHQWRFLQNGREVATVESSMQDASR